MADPRAAGAPPLLLIDLDNTLIDRAAAFRRWALAFAADVGAPQSAADWIVAADGDGLTPRPALVEAISDRFGLESRRRADVLADLRFGYVEASDADSGSASALTAARAAGWAVVVVTNGDVAQQERKLRVTGLDRQVDGWVISAAVGYRKPDPRIFRAAAAAVHTTLDRAWMIGDSPDADIAGAHRLGMSSAWLSRGRTWSHAQWRPTLVADRCATAIRAVTASRAFS